MKRAATTTLIAVAALAVPAQALGAPMLGAPLPTARSAQSATTTTPTTTSPTTTATTTTPTTTVPSKPARLTINDIADHRALSAYATYLSTLIAQEPIGLNDDSSYVATISQPGTGGCKAALSKLTQPPYQLDAKAQHTLTMLGEEIGDDVTIAYDLSATEPFTKFASVLANLRWGRLSGATLVIKRYLGAQTDLLALPASDLCQDASDAELHPDTVPDGTKTFLADYSLLSSRASAGLTGLLTLMQTYEVPAEKALLARITTLADQLATQTKTDLLQSGTTLTSTLEST
jgi:hypothetical protein